MRHTICLIYLVITCFFFQIVSAHEPSPNLDLYKKTLVQYHDSGAYEKDLNKISLRIIHYLNTCHAENASSLKHKKLAIVFDIDETLLSNYSFIKGNDFSLPLMTIRNNQPKAEDSAIKPIRNVYYTAIHDHIAVFFISGRTKQIKAVTIKNLHNQGYQNWNQLILKPKDYHEATVSTFKTTARKHIEDSGYEIVANIGDQKSDLMGGYADKTFKLPNPYYYIP